MRERSVRSSGASGSSCACPGARAKPMARPEASAITQALVPKPPRERPSPSRASRSAAVPPFWPHLRPCGGLELSGLGREGLLALLQFAPLAAVLLKAQHARQVGLGQALDLLLDADLPAPQALPTRLQFLRQPVLAVRPLQGLADRLWLGKQLAQILPDQCLDLFGRDEAGRAWRIPA